MKRIVAILLTLMLCAGVLVGCQPTSTNNAVDEHVTVPTPPAPTPVNEYGKAFVGTWTVQAQKSLMVLLELHEDGTALMTALNGSKLSGRFTVENATEMTLSFSGDLHGTYVIANNTITVNADNGDILVLTKRV